MDIYRFYEINLLLDPGMNQSSINSLLEEFMRFLGGFGPVSILEQRQKFELAYPVKNKKVAHWYSLLFCSILGDVVQKLKDKLRLNDSVLRFMILKLSKGEVKKLHGVEELKNSALEIYQKFNSKAA
ncbi:MAG: 30S ribosomal protein S6 [Deltaproteobacteria bacterium]|nr:30S ribosomal protein S6 [Deltaproteobacteria bacterium]